MNSLVPKEEQPKPEQQATADERKAENQRKAEILRAKLIAQRQNTPMKTRSVAALSRPETPAKQLQQKSPQPPTSTVRGPENGAPSSDALGLEALLAEGRAAAAKAHQQNAPAKAIEPPAQSHVTAPAPKKTVVPAADTQNTIQSTPVKPEANHQQKFLTDVYYADLPAWLEMTGYHDVAYRTGKLYTYQERYKERKALEEEAARINERLAKLRNEEQAELEALRSSVAHPSSGPAGAPPPSLPAEMPLGDAAIVAAVANKLTNGVKRPHSPGPSDKISRRRDDATPGFRIRGANDSPSDARPPTRRQSPPASIERRISYPDARRRSLDGPRSRDPSLERRQAYYKRDGEARLPPSGPPGSRYDQYPSRDVREAPRNYPRGGNAPPYNGGGGSRSGYREHTQQYRGSAGLDLPKGGQSTKSRHA